MSLDVKDMRRLAKERSSYWHSVSVNASQLVTLCDLVATLTKALEHSKAAMHNLSVMDQANRRDMEIPAAMVGPWADLNAAQIAVDTALGAARAAGVE